MYMEKYIELTPEEIKLGFVASCVEFVALAMQRPYREIFERMQKAKMLKEYIYKHYEAIHTQSREHVTEDLINYLKREETKACKQ